VDVLQVELAVEAMTPEREKTPPRHDEVVDYAWRVHGALDSWTGKVDTKASIALAIEIAVLGFVVAQADPEKRFHDLSGGNLHWYRAAIVLMLLAVLLSLFVVTPQLNRRRSRREWRRNTIFFGHLRHWDPQELAAKLREDRLQEEQLARQLVAMSKIAWRKHASLQWSLVTFALGTACLVLAT
jgi:hypothetical protein